MVRTVSNPIINTVSLSVTAFNPNISEAIYPIQISNGG
jgi:hypothetical protein